MPPTPLVVIAVDGLRASALGAYGNTLFPTPALDRLASESISFDRFVLDSVDLPDIYRSLLGGVHAMAPDRDLPKPTLGESLAASGFVSHLVTDEPQLVHHPSLSGIDEVTLLDTDTTQAASTATETATGQVLAAAAEVALSLTDGDKPPLLWVHLRGCCGPWDAPPELADSLVEEEDPPLEPSIAIPQGTVPPGDPDDGAFFATCRYAGQIMAFDQCLEAFLATLPLIWPATPPALLLLGTRGFALGEHGTLGQGGLYSEQLHTPLLVRLPDQSQGLARSHSLVQPHQLSEMLGQLASGEFVQPTDGGLAVSQCGGRVALRTHDWLAVELPPSDSSHPWELYVKPDDQWEANDVASLCHDEIEQFTQLRAAVLEAAAAGQPFFLPKEEEEGAGQERESG